MLAVSTSSAAALTEDGSNSTGTAAATATATANTSTPASTMKRQGYSHRSIEPPPPFFTRWSHPLLDDAPVFTEPAADFATHSQQLLELVEEVYRLRDAYYGGGGSVAENGTSTANPDGAAFDYNSSVSSATQLSSLDYKQRLTAEKNRYLSALVGRVLERLNVLTKPPLKKKKKRSAVAGGKDSSSVCESTNDSKMPSSLSSSSMHLSSTQSEHTFDFSLSNQQKAYYYFLRGHLYNALPIAHPLVEENLAKAIKLDPTLVRAWNSMGEFYWKKGDLGAARNCFESAIAFERNKESLRRLSMVYRQWPGSRWCWMLTRVLD